MSKHKCANENRKPAYDIIIVCLLVLIGISGYKIYSIVSGYMASQNVYEDVRNDASEVGFTGDIDWDKLRKTNEDVVGWIYLKDSNIDYPIVQSRDNKEYLTTLFDKTYGVSGSIFVDCNTENPFKQFSTVVYGHHMKDGSMFNNLKKYKDRDYADIHSRFELVTPDEKYHLDVAALLNIPADSSIYTSNVTEENREEFITAINNLAEYRTEVKINYNDKIVILSTCAYEYEGARYVIIGKLTPWA